MTFYLEAGIVERGQTPHARYNRCFSSGWREGHELSAGHRRQEYLELEPAAVARHAAGRNPVRRDQHQAAQARHARADPAPFACLAILEYLAEAHPEARLWPEAQEARALARSAAAEMHAGFAALREHCPMDFLARLPMATLPDPVAADVRRIVELWRDCRRRHGGTGPFLFGAFCAADAMYGPVASRFRTYLPDLAPYGDDGVAQAYVDALLALPAMLAWEEGARGRGQRHQLSRYRPTD
jgi:glutathione S-transferase